MGPLSLQWASTARSDLRRLRTWAERYGGAKAARALAQHLRHAVERLAFHPRLGRSVALPDSGTEELRELVVGPFVVRYTVERERVVVLRVWHGREQRGSSHGQL